MIKTSSTDTDAPTATTNMTLKEQAEQADRSSMSKLTASLIRRGNSLPRVTSTAVGELVADILAKSRDIHEEKGGVITQEKALKLACKELKEATFAEANEVAKSNLVIAARLCHYQNKDCSKAELIDTFNDQINEWSSTN